MINMQNVQVRLLDSNNNPQYGLNWGHRDNRDKNQSYIQLSPEVYRSYFFPIKGTYFLVNTDDGDCFVMNRAQKTNEGTAIQTPENNSILGKFLRNRLGLADGAEITFEDLRLYERIDVEFYKVDNRHFIMDFNKEWKSDNLAYLYEVFLILFCNVNKNLKTDIKEIQSINYTVSPSGEIIIDSASNHTLSDNCQHFLSSDFLKKHYGKKPKEIKITDKNLYTNSFQQIFYGAPGTGKSYTINETTKGEDAIRTTFHPDSDYATFVGAYKPTTIEETVMTVIGTKAVPVEDKDGKERKESKIVYEFVAQAFLQAYVEAWKKYATAEGDPKKQYLVIEEINRGNCAQVFGDLFQLLDRNDSGFSDYPIKADSDMQRQLKKAFEGLELAQKEAINELYDGRNVADEVLNGDILLLPNNLYIWATMNTSDQSLFPIDSAFKRRWDWSYMPISDAHLNWTIEVGNNSYDWWSFLEKINEKIGATTNSEDKKMGYFFCKATEGVISAEKFVGKVVFYLWNDIFKDYEFSDRIFDDNDGNKLTFDKFYTAEGKNAQVVADKVALFLNNLGLAPLNQEEETAEEEANISEEAL